MHSVSVIDSINESINLGFLKWPKEYKLLLGLLEMETETIRMLSVAGQ